MKPSEFRRQQVSPPQPEESWARELCLGSGLVYSTSQGHPSLSRWSESPMHTGTWAILTSYIWQTVSTLSVLISAGF